VGRRQSDGAFVNLSDDQVQALARDKTIDQELRRRALGGGEIPWTAAESREKGRRMSNIQVYTQYMSARRGKYRWRTTAGSPPGLMSLR
jgi:hypothetical protein